MKAYWINATDQTVTEVDSTGLSDLQRMVGGYIEIAKRWDSQDVLFADEDGLMKGGAAGWFRIAGKEQPISGNGVVVGPEDDEGESGEPTFTLAALQAEVVFVTPEQVAAWARANSSEPAISFHFPGHDQIFARTGELFGQAPPTPKKDRP